MKKTAGAFLCCILILSFLFSSVPFSFAASLDDFNYSVNDGNFIEITSLKNPDAENIVIPDSYMSVYTVTSIGEGAFAGCRNLKSVTLPSTIRSIGKRAYYDCSSLNSVTFELNSEKQPEPVEIGDYAFYGCSALSEINLPDTVEKIGDNAFSWCVSLGKMKIPESVSSIGVGAFSCCSSLKKVVIDNYAAELPTSGSLLPKTAVIYGYPKSTAALYAAEYSFSFETIECNAHIKSSYWVVKKAPTCIAEGEKYRECLRCFSELENTVIGKSAHTVKDGYCTYCKAWVNIATVPKITLSNTVAGTKISWSAVTGTEKYYVFKMNTEGKWKAITYVLATNSLSFVDTSATSGTASLYTVRPYSKGVLGGYNKAGVSLVFLSAPVISSVKNGKSGAVVKWGKVNGAKSYTVYRKTSGSSWTVLNSVPSGTLSYTDKTAKSSVTYTYTLRAVSGNVRSSYKSGMALKYLAAPVLDKAVNTVKGVYIKWTAVTGASGYYVYRKSGSSGWTKIATVKGKSTVSYVDASVSNGKSYVYTVRSFSGSVGSGYDETGLKIKFVSAPRSSSAISTKSGVVFKWRSVKGATGYTVYRKTGNGRWTALKTASASATYYTDKTAKKGVTYTYTVTALNGSYKSSYYSGIKCKDKY